MKILVLFSVIVMTVAVKAQLETDSLVTSTLEDEVIKFQEKGLLILEIRIFAANLPEDLLAKALDVLLNAQIQFDACKVALGINHVVWQYKVCIITQLKTANIEIKLLEIEAADRLAVTTTPAATM